jgi:hypothetical protein
MAKEHEQLHTGGCLCGALRYEAHGAPQMMGHCYCADCRKASGSGFIPFMSFRREAIRFTGESLMFVSKSARGSDAHRNSCPVCASLVFGGVRGESESFTIYAGSLDDPTLFAPQLAIFTRGRPDWAVIPPGIASYEALPT